MARNGDPLTSADHGERMRKMKKTPLLLLGSLRSACCLWHREMGKHLVGTGKLNLPDGTLGEAVLQSLFRGEKGQGWADFRFIFQSLVILKCAVVGLVSETFS